MADAISIQELIDARTDAKTLEEAVNGDAVTTVLSRLGESYPTLSNALNQIDSKLDSADTQIKQGITNLFENGGLPATPFATKVLMESSELVDGDYAMVTDDTVNNGLYIKTAGAWVKSDYDISNIVSSTEKLGKAGRVFNKSDVTATILKGVGWDGTRFTAISETTFSLLFDVVGGTTVTLYVGRGAEHVPLIPRLGFWAKSPDYWGGANKPDAFLGYGSLEGMTDVSGEGFYVTFDVPEGMTKMVYDTRLYDRKFWLDNKSIASIALEDGVYDPTVWSSLNSLSIFENKVRMRALDVDQVTGKAFTDNKNLFKGYGFGTAITRNKEIGVELPSVYMTVVPDTDPTYKRVVTAFVPVKPNTTYTISKGVSDKFSLAICDRNYKGKILFMDSVDRSYTLTTEATTELLYIEVSVNYEQPLLQVELGTEVTNYMPYEKTLSDTSTPYAGKLNEDTNLLAMEDNKYIDLGVTTNEWSGKKYVESDYINEYYEPLLLKYPQSITKSVIGRDASDTYDMVKYVFEPDHYEQTIFISSGMHPTEAIPPFALGELLVAIYDNPDKHPMLSYMRNCVRFIVIPTLNPWGMNVLDKTAPLNYRNVNGVNISRGFYNRWYRYTPRNAYDTKGSAPLTQDETLVMISQLELYKDEITMVFDCHTGETWNKDAFIYWLDDDKYLKPALEQVVSMMNDKIRIEKGREPNNETMESDRILNIYFASRTLGIPAATIEYGAAGTTTLGSTQMTEYVNQLFNYMSAALNARLGDKKEQDKRNEHNKPYISLYNFLDGHNEYIDEFVGLDTLIANGMQSVGLVSSPLVVGAESSIVKLTHTPANFDRTVVVMAGARGQSKKDVVSLAFTAYKFMTDDNPYIVALRKRTKLVFIPALNPVGVGNKSVNNASGVPPFDGFSTSTQVEANDLRAFLDAGGIDYVVQLDAYNGTNTKPHADYALLQTISSNKYVSDFDGLVENLERKYNADIDIKSSAIGEVTNPALSDYIATKSIPFTYIYLSQNILPKREPIGSGYVDYGYEANEMALCSEVTFNAIKDMTSLLQQKQALTLIGA